MKKLTLSIAAVMAMSTFAIAGGDIAPVEEPMVEVVEPVVDDSGFYLGLAYGMANAQNDVEWIEEYVLAAGSNTLEIDYDTVMLQAGYQFNKYLAVEGRYWHSFTDGEYSYKGEVPYGGYIEESGDDYGDELTAWGIYVKPMYPVTEAFTIYGLLGYGNVTLSCDDGDLLDESGFQWGAGASYAFTDNLSFFVDYVELYNDETFESGEEYVGHYWEEQEDTKVYTVNFGVTYQF